MIMKASKVIELVKKHHIPNLSPSTVENIPYQTVADADIFGPCNVAVLKPNPKPAANFACLPGTKRRPLKAWQLCSDEEKVSTYFRMGCIIDCAYSAML
jgi:hypothetical protein